MLLTYAGIPDKKKALMIRRVKKAYKGAEMAKVGLYVDVLMLFIISCSKIHVQREGVSRVVSRPRLDLQLNGYVS